MPKNEVLVSGKVDDIDFVLKLSIVKLMNQLLSLRFVVASKRLTLHRGVRN